MNQGSDIHAYRKRISSKIEELYARNLEVSILHGSKEVLPRPPRPLYKKKFGGPPRPLNISKYRSIVLHKSEWQSYAVKWTGAWIFLIGPEGLAIYFFRAGEVLEDELDSEVLQRLRVHRVHGPMMCSDHRSGFLLQILVLGELHDPGTS